MLKTILIEVWRAFTANRLRTWLTILGMVIGVSAVVLMMSIGSGAKDSIKRMISSMGSNLLIVLSGSTTSGGLRMGMGATPTLTIDDADAIAELPHVVSVSPLIRDAAQLVYGSNNWSASVYGVNSHFFDIQNWDLASGTIFMEADVRAATRVAVIGQTIAQNLFGGENPVGKIIRVQKNPYLIVGELAPKGQSVDGRDQDDALFIPVTTAQRKLFGTKFHGSVRLIIVQVDSKEALLSQEEKITDLLRQRHHLSKMEDNDFSVRNLTALANMAVQAAQILSLMLGAVASISLIVGGIGIMNIMLVSVTERTREIGIRAALGARRRDILWQFLMEAVLLSLFGCLIGIFIGISGAFLTYKIFGLNIVISLQSILIAFLVAGSIGIFFGYYPARKAACLKPITALQYQ